MATGFGTTIAFPRWKPILRPGRFLRGDEKVMGCLARADTVYMSVVVLGELFAGFKAGSKEKGNKELLERFLTKPTVPVTYDTPFAQIPGLRIWDEAGS